MTRKPTVKGRNSRLERKKTTRDMREDQKQTREREYIYRQSGKNMEPPHQKWPNQITGPQSPQPLNRPIYETTQSAAHPTPRESRTPFSLRKKKKLMTEFHTL